MVLPSLPTKVFSSSGGVLDSLSLTEFDLISWETVTVWNSSPADFKFFSRVERVLFPLSISAFRSCSVFDTELAKELTLFWLAFTFASNFSVACWISRSVFQSKAFSASVTLFCAFFTSTALWATWVFALLTTVSCFSTLAWACFSSCFAPANLSSVFLTVTCLATRSFSTFLIFSGLACLANSCACFKASSALFLFVTVDVCSCCILSTSFWVFFSSSIVWFSFTSAFFTSDSETSASFLVSDWLTVDLVECLFTTSSACAWPLKAVTIAVATPKPINTCSFFIKSPFL